MRETGSAVILSGIFIGESRIGLVPRSLGFDLTISDRHICSLIGIPEGEGLSRWWYVDTAMVLARRMIERDALDFRFENGLRYRAFNGFYVPCQPLPPETINLMSAEIEENLTLSPKDVFIKFPQTGPH